MQVAVERAPAGLQDPKGPVDLREVRQVNQTRHRQISGVQPKRHRGLGQAQAPNHQAPNHRQRSHRRHHHIARPLPPVQHNGHHDIKGQPGLQPDGIQEKRRHEIRDQGVRGDQTPDSSGGPC